MVRIYLPRLIQDFKPYLHHLDGNSCRQVVKARRDVIEQRYAQALILLKLFT
jgi:hypothetical protein